MKSVSKPQHQIKLRINIQKASSLKITDGDSKQLKDACLNVQKGFIFFRLVAVMHSL